MCGNSVENFAGLSTLFLHLCTFFVELCTFLGLSTQVDEWYNTYTNQL